MLIGRESLRCDRSDALRGRIRRYKFWMAALKIDKLSKERIVLCVADARIVEDVILVIGILDCLAKLADPLGVGSLFNYASRNR